MNNKTPDNKTNKYKELPKFNIPIDDIRNEFKDINKYEDNSTTISNGTNTYNSIEADSFLKRKNVFREIGKTEPRSLEKKNAFEEINKEGKKNKIPIFKIPVEEIRNHEMERIELLKKNLTPKICNHSANNKVNCENEPNLDKTKPFEAKNNNLNYNIGNKENQNLFSKYSNFIKQKEEFYRLKNLALTAMKNPNNINNYMYNIYNNNNLINQFPQTSYINLNFNNYINYNFTNPIMPVYFQNQYYNQMNNIGNMNETNPLYNISNMMNLNLNDPGKYTITVRSRPKNSNIEKFSKIKVVTSYLNKQTNSKNIIKIEDILSGKEKRTFVRLSPIPDNYSSYDVAKLIDKYLKIESGKNQRIYKALSTPLCKKGIKNLGYCFIKMIKPQYVIDFYNAFNGKFFFNEKIKKPFNVIWADYQEKDFSEAGDGGRKRHLIVFKDIKIE